MGNVLFGEATPQQQSQRTRLGGKSELTNKIFESIGGEENGDQKKRKEAKDQAKQFAEEEKRQLAEEKETAERVEPNCERYKELSDERAYLSCLEREKERVNSVGY